MRYCGIALSLLLACGCTSAKDDKTKEKDEPKSIAVGDPAPPLAVDIWLNGTGIKAIEPGKIYVLEFWATWCGPCLEAMPELGETAKEYADKNVVVIPITTVTDRNPKKTVEKYVEKVGRHYGLTFAVCEKSTMHKTWWEAAGAEGYPTTFIVDKQGKIVYVGHPMDIVDILPKVVDGTWKGEAGLKEIAIVQLELQTIQEKGEKQPETALKDLIAYEVKYPAKAKQTNVIFTKLLLLMNLKKYDEAKAYTEAILPAAVAAKRSSTLDKIMAIWAAPQLNPEKKHVGLSIKALEALLQLAGKEPTAQLLFNAAEVYHLNGNKPKALEYLDAALKAEDNPETKRQMAELGAEFRK